MSTCGTMIILGRAQVATEHSPIAVFRLYDTKGALVTGLYNCIFASTKEGRRLLAGFNEDFIGLYSSESLTEDIRLDLQKESASRSRRSTLN